VRILLAVLTQSFKQDFSVQMGIEASHMFTEKKKKSPQWDSYLLINTWFMWSTPNKIGTKYVRTAPSNIATKDLGTPLGMHHCTKSVLF